MSEKCTNAANQHRSVFEIETSGGETFRAGHGYTMFFEDQYLGDHSQLWVVQMQDGIETMRWNAAYVACICWDLAAPTDGVAP